MMKLMSRLLSTIMTLTLLGLVSLCPAHATWSIDHDLLRQAADKITLLVQRQWMWYTQDIYLRLDALHIAYQAQWDEDRVYILDYLKEAIQDLLLDQWMSTVLSQTKEYTISTRKVVALTFDDGPHVTNTPYLLDILSQYGVKGTFFVLWERVASYPDITKRIVEEWHEIANHTRDHPDLRHLSHADIDRQMRATSDTIYETTGIYPRFMRPPYGALDALARDTIYTPMILRSIDPLDWKVRDADRVAAHISYHVHPGAIILLHDLHRTSVDAVPAIIEDLQAKWYTFVTISELVQINRDDREAYQGALFTQGIE